MPLEEIGDFLHNRDTGRIQELLSKQLVQVHKKQQELAVMEHQIKNRLNQIQGALSAHPGEIFLEKKPPLKLACMKKQLNPENYLDLEYSIREMEQGNSPASIFLGKVGVGLFYESLKVHRFKPYDFVFIILEEDDPIKGQVIHIPESTWAIVRFHGSHEQAPGFYEKLLAYFKDEGFAPESFALEMTLIDYGLTHDQSQFITEIQIPLNPDCPGIIA